MTQTFEDYKDQVIALLKTDGGWSTRQIFYGMKHYGLIRDNWERNIDADDVAANIDDILDAYYGHVAPGIPK